MAETVGIVEGNGLWCSLSGFSFLESQSWISVHFLLSYLCLGAAQDPLQQLLFGMGDSSAHSGLGKAVVFPTVIACCQICSLSCWENEISSSARGIFCLVALGDKLRARWLCMASFPLGAPGWSSSTLRLVQSAWGVLSMGTEVGGR